MTKKVIVRIIGGLGNQLFSYAAARRLALVNDAELVIDHVSGFKYDKQYKRQYQLDQFNIPCRKAMASERLEPFSRLRRYILKRINKLRPFEKRSYLFHEGIDFDPRLLDVKVRGTVYLEGYWQSEDYFKDVEQTIRQDLKIKEPKDSVNLAMAERIRSCNAVGIHVRFFDDPLSGGVNNVSVEYYSRSVQELEKLVPNAHYFIFSDRPEAARDLIPLPNERVTLVSHNKGDSLAHVDLWLMSLCQHFIIANSTLSWWGAWLADNKDKIVIAPAIRLEGKTAWGFRGLLPYTWMKI